MIFTNSFNPRFFLFILALSFIGALIGGISIYRNETKLQNATICEFNSYEDVMLLESGKASDIASYLNFCDDQESGINFKWSPINAEVDEVYILESLYDGQILKIKFLGQIYGSSSRQEWIEGYVHKKNLKNCFH